jgi:hypothetical protein
VIRSWRQLQFEDAQRQDRQNPPVITGMPTGCVLWTVTQKLVQVTTVTAADALSGLTPGPFKVTGTSNEPSDPNNPDIVITPNGSSGYVVELRPERSHREVE